MLLIKRGGSGWFETLSKAFYLKGRAGHPKRRRQGAKVLVFFHYPDRLIVRVFPISHSSKK